LWCCGCRPAASSKRRKYAKMDCSHMGILKGNEGGKEEGKDMEKKKKWGEVTRRRCNEKSVNNEQLYCSPMGIKERLWKGKGCNEMLQKVIRNDPHEMRKNN
jgi:hypothetical protein